MKAPYVGTERPLSHREKRKNGNRRMPSAQQFLAPPSCYPFSFFSGSLLYQVRTCSVSVPLYVVHTCYRVRKGEREKQDVEKGNKEISPLFMVATRSSFLYSLSLLAMFLKGSSTTASLSPSKPVKCTRGRRRGDEEAFVVRKQVAWAVQGGS